MNRNNNLSPIPFYESLEEQDFRKWYAYGKIYKNIVSESVLVPFFLSHPNTSASISWIKFFKCCDEEITGSGSFNISFNEAFNTSQGGQPLGTILLNNMSSFVSGDHKIYYFPIYGFLGMALPRGYFYIQIHFSDNTDRYSDIFYVEPSAAHRGITLKWYDAEDLEYADGVIPYGHNIGANYYGSVVYLDSEIGMPEYSNTEDGEERDGRFFPIKRISEKVYKFKIVVPEYMCDLLRTVGLSDVIYVKDQYGREYYPDHFEIDVNWLEGGDLAEVICTFETDTVVKKIGKSYGTINSR